MPDTVQTRLGTLQFADGVPDKATVAKLYDNLDFQRGVQAFLNTNAAASMVAMRRGLRSQGADNQTVILFETLTDSKSLYLTANTETAYAFMWLDTRDGPVVIETPPNCRRAMRAPCRKATTCCVHARTATGRAVAASW